MKNPKVRLCTVSSVRSLYKIKSRDKRQETKSTAAFSVNGVVPVASPSNLSSFEALPIAIALFLPGKPGQSSTVSSSDTQIWNRILIELVSYVIGWI